MTGLFALSNIATKYEETLLSISFPVRCDPSKGATWRIGLQGKSLQASSFDAIPAGGGRILATFG